MAMQSNRLDKANPLKLGRRFGSGQKNSGFGLNAPVPASQRGAANGAPNTNSPRETNSSEFRIALHAETAGLGAARAHAEKDFSRSERWLGCIFVAEHAGAAVLMESYGLHAVSPAAAACLLQHVFAAHPHIDTLKLPIP